MVGSRAHGRAHIRYHHRHKRCPEGDAMSHEVPIVRVEVFSDYT